MRSKLVITRYKLNSDLHPDIRGILKIALVADLHDRDPKPVLALLRRENPDLIFSAGDLMERKEEGMTQWTDKAMDELQDIKKIWRLVCGAAKVMDVVGGLVLGVDNNKKNWNIGNSRIFLREASRIAPVYMGVGNHEWYFLPEDYEVMKKSKVTLLDNADVPAKLRKAGSRILIGGLSTHYDLEWLKRFSGREGYKVLICHHPEYYLRFIQGTEYDKFDLIVSGHCHGGQWRIFGHSVFAPGQGLFPKYAYGMHDTHRSGGKLIISAGCVNTANFPRWGNPCELVIIEIG